MAQLKSTTIGKYQISHELGVLYVSGDYGLILRDTCDDPRDVDHLISLAADACSRQAKTYLNAYRDISGKTYHQFVEDLGDSLGIS